MKMTKVALFIIMSLFVSQDTEDIVVDHCCFNCYVCEKFEQDDIEFYSLDME